MARPRSNSKAPKQRGGAGSGKRKLGGAPPGGGSGGRPAKQSRGEGRTKPIDRDVFEAEDSDPDEVKHAERFDKVDNYEYELPSDFEDEEIDEDLAFTEEDKKKFGAWFEKEVSADEDDEGAIIGDDDGEDFDDDEDEDGDADDEDGGRRERAVEDDDDDLFLGDASDDEDDDIDGLGEDDGEDGDGDEDEERHRSMLLDVLGAADGGARKRARRDPNAAVVSEAYPESEYNLNPGAASAGGSAAGTLSIADLLESLTGEERRKLGAARRLLEKVAGAGGGKAGGGKGGMQPVAVPLPSIVADRQERKAGYEAATEDVTKWQSIVKANREAPTLRLVPGRAEVPRVSTTAALVAQHIPSADNALEAEVLALLEAAGADSSRAMEEAEEKMALKALSLEEAKERRERLAKLRSLLFYHELKSRRLKAIKSKEYHRHLSRAAKRKATKLAAAASEGGGDGDVDAERAAAIEAEFQRAKERLTQRHRNSSRWARRALKRGQLQVDDGTKAALAEQLQLGQQLKRKIEGRKGSGSDSDASTSASDDDGGGGEGDGGGAAGSSGVRVRSAALELLAGGGPMDLEGASAPKKGLLALPFMKRAMERRRLTAQQEAEQMLKDLDEQELLQQQEGETKDGRQEVEGHDLTNGDGGGGLLEALVGYSVPRTVTAGVSGGGRRKFGGGGAAAAAAAAASAANKAAAAGEGSDLDSDDAEDADAKAERLGRRTKGAAVAAAAAAKQAAGRGKKGRKGEGAALPTAADEADLDAAIAAGAVGRGLLVASSDAGVDLAVAGGAADDSDAADMERRESGRRAGTRAAGAAGSGKGPGILADIAAQQASLAAGGGRAALFEGTAAGKAGAAGSAAAAAAAPKFIAAKKFGGVRPGYSFKKGAQGLGYYWDAKSAAAAAGAGTGLAAGGDGKGKKGKQQQQQTTQTQQQQHGKETGVAVAGKPTQVQQEAQPQKQGEEQKAAAANDGGAAAVKAGAGDDDEDAPMMRPVGTGSDQRDIIRQAFAGDDVEAEFAAEKAAAVAEELPAVDEPSTLPGWGAWVGQQRNPRWMQAAKDKAAKTRADAAAGRQDAQLKYVVVSEKWDKKSIKYTAPAAPFPFTSQEAYERSLRQPLGRDYNPDTAFRDLTRPAVLKQAGVAIAPLKYSESVAKQLGKRGKKAEAARESMRVVTVAGGMPRPGGGGKKKKNK